MVKRILLAGLASCLIAIAAGAQATPGDVLATDQGGTIWLFDKTNTISTFAVPPAAPFGIDIDYNGDVICGGTSALWRLDRNTAQVTTILNGTPLSGLVADIEVYGNTYFVTALGLSSVLRVDAAGNVTTQYPLASRGWGMGLDVQNNYLFVATSTSVNRIDLTLGAVTTLFTGAPLNFCQGGEFGPRGKFIFADETGKEVFEIDQNGVITTAFMGAPFADVGEGISIMPNGDVLLSDDGSAVTPKVNNIWRLDVRTNTLTTFASAGPINDYNSLVVVPDLVLIGQSSNVRIGSSQNFLVTSTGAQLEPYVFASSLSANRGTPLPGARTFPLDFDNMMSAVLGNVFPTIFVNFQGILDQTGSTILTVNVPNDPNLIGLDFYTAGVSLHVAAPGAIHLISNPFSTRVTS